MISLNQNSDTSDTEGENGNKNKKILKRVSTQPDKHHETKSMERAVSHHFPSEIERIVWDKPLGIMPKVDCRLYLFDLNGSSFNIVFYSCGGQIKDYSS